MSNFEVQKVALRSTFVIRLFEIRYSCSSFAPFVRFPFGGEAVDIYLIRHADALALGERGITDDAERPLSDKGEAQSKTVAKALHRCGVKLDHLFASPLVRAQQTADLMIKAWSHSGLSVETCEELEPGSKPRKLSRFLLKQEGEHMGLVGHMPHLAEVAAWLIGSKKAQIDIAKAGVACLSCGDAAGKGMAVLRWLVTPDWYGD